MRSLNTIYPGLKVAVVLVVLTLVLMGGMGLNWASFFSFFLLLDHTLRPTCKFLILAILYQKKSWKFCKYKFYYISSWNGGRVESTPNPFIFICENNRKIIRLCTVLIFFSRVVAYVHIPTIFNVLQLSFDGVGVISTHNR